MRPPVTALISLAAAACAHSNGPAADASGGDDGDAADPLIDAERIDADPADPDGPPPVAGPQRLALSEIVLTPTEAEMIEIANPTAATIDLTDYWLTDVATYFQLPGGGHTISTSDFIARFPFGATIAAGAVQTIAVGSAATFQTRYGVAPTYALVGGTMTVTLDATSTAATITNTGEPVIVFFWDGLTDVVTDVDIMIAGAPSAPNMLQNKSAIAVDGPDGDSTATAYATDAMTIGNTAVPGLDLSIKRVMDEAGHEGTGTGNGVGGDDETSEATATTWDSTFTAPNPGTRSF